MSIFSPVGFATILHEKFALVALTVTAAAANLVALPQCRPQFVNLVLKSHCHRPTWTLSLLSLSVSLVSFGAPKLVHAQSPVGSAADAAVDAVGPAASATKVTDGSFVRFARFDLVFGTPVVLQTGFANGVQVAVASAGPLRVGAALGWTSANEWSSSWAVTHDEFRAVATASWERRMGNGLWLVQGSAGAIAVREYRLRHQSWRTDAGKQEQTAWGATPFAAAHVGAAVRVAGNWGTVLTFGPCWPSGDNPLGFNGHVGLGWMP